MERSSLKIIDIQEAKGNEHDFKVYKDTIGKGISTSIPLDADGGYQGIEAYHPNRFIPIQSRKNPQLTEKEKTYNKELECGGVVIEQINGKIKPCRCRSYPFLTGDIAEIDMF
jgi:hypothetical protein